MKRNTVIILVLALTLLSLMILFIFYGEEQHLEFEEESEKIPTKIQQEPNIVVPFKEIVIIIMKNGGVIKGIVEEKNDQGIVIDVGFGTVAVSKEDIEKVDRVIDNESRKTIYDELKVHKVDEDEETLKKRLEKEEKEILDRIEEAEEIQKEAAKGRIAVTEITYRNRSRIMVMTNINNKIDIPMLVDTGANLVLIYPETAMRLGIKLRNENALLFQLADGSTKPGVPITLRSVKVGNAEATNVRAAVILGAEKPAQEVGLLGMSFLRNFHVKIDTDNNKLTLEKK